jgi:hypothetical protein
MLRRIRKGVGVQVPKGRGNCEADCSSLGFSFLSYSMKVIRCPICGDEIPSEFMDVASSEDDLLVVKIECLTCGRCFAIREEKSL